MTAHRIRLDSRPEEAHRLLDWLDPVLADSGFEPVEAFNLRCAVVELVNNSIVHAYGGEAGHPVEIRLELGGGLAVVEVRDLGPPFDGPTTSAPGDLFSESGRGYDIIRAWVDRMTFGRSGHWNVCTIEKSVVRPSPPD